MATMRNEAVFKIPDTEELLAAQLSPADVERMVLDIASDETLQASWSYAARSVDSVSSTAVMGSYAMARQSGLPVDDSLNLPTWSKTIWRRYC
jgi:hypothetical protein